ncbi:MAG: hypothetical protein ACXVZ4_14465 [Gaiellaceae bacterium]
MPTDPNRLALAALVAAVIGLPLALSSPLRALGILLIAVAVVVSSVAIVRGVRQRGWLAVAVALLALALLVLVALGIVYLFLHAGDAGSG